MAGTFEAAKRWLSNARGRLVVAAVIVVGLYFVIAFGEQAWKARALEAEVAEREAVIADMEAQRAELSAQIEEYSSDSYLAYVEQIARRDLNLSRPGETVLLVRWLDSPTPSPTPSPSPASETTTDSNWEKWIDFFRGD